MRYLWVAAVGAGLAAGPVAAKPAKLKVPSLADIPHVMAPPPPPPIYVSPPPPSPVRVAPPPPPFAPPTPPVDLGKSRPPKPRGSPGSWITTNDYPLAALRQEREGATRFRALIGPDGRVTECQIVASSGSADLDSQTCALITRRARFIPALDRDGNPTIGAYSTAVRWIIPEDYRPYPALGSVTVRFAVASDGTLSDCNILASSGDLGEDFPAGEAQCATDRFKSGFTDSKGRMLARVVTVKSVVSLRDIPSPANGKFANSRESSLPTARLGTLGWGAPSLWDEALGTVPAAGMVTVTSRISPQGELSDCRVVRSVGPVAKVITPGSIACEEDGYDRPDKEGSQVAKQLVLTATTTIAPMPASKRVKGKE